MYNLYITYLYHSPNPIYRHYSIPAEPEDTVNKGVENVDEVSNTLLGEPSVTALVVPFVACGDLTNKGFDSDKSYPLEMSSLTHALTTTTTPSTPIQSGDIDSHTTNNTSNNTNGTDATLPIPVQSDSYTYISPIQPPIKPNYYRYLQEHATK